MDIDKKIPIIYCTICEDIRYRAIEYDRKLIEYHNCEECKKIRLKSLIKK